MALGAICAGRRGARDVKDILSRAGRELLRRFSASDVLLAFDYDGTLAPIVGDPARAEMRALTRRLLVEATARYPCIVVSGRSRADVRKRMRGIRLRGIVGNHGIEPWQASAGLRRDVRRWTPLLARRLGGLPGVWIEDKGFSLAIHYRGSPAKQRTRQAILEALAALGPARVVGGRQVLNVLPQDAPHKGLALLHERARLGKRTAIYVGDDETDEDVFALGQPGRLLTIRVGAKRSSRAACYLRSQRAVDELLAALVELRSAKTPASRGR